MKMRDQIKAKRKALQMEKPKFNIEIKWYGDEYDPIAGNLNQVKPQKVNLQHAPYQQQEPVN